MPKATSTPRHARRGDDLSQWREAARHPLFTASFVERPGFTKHDFEEALAAKLKKVCASPEVARDALHSLSPGGPHSEPVIGLPVTTVFTPLLYIYSPLTNLGWSPVLWCEELPEPGLHSQIRAI